jgi:hypothetical protein
VKLATWRRAMLASGAVLLLVGVVAMVGGGLYAGREQYEGASGDIMTGIWVGSFGTLAVVTGVVLGKLALFGPVPRSMQHEAPSMGPDVEGPEADE